MTWFFTLFKKELVEIRHDLRRPVFLFGAALAYLIVFGMLYIPNIVTAAPFPLAPTIESPSQSPTRILSLISSGH